MQKRGNHEIIKCHEFLSLKNIQDFIFYKLNISFVLGLRMMLMYSDLYV